MLFLMKTWTFAEEDMSVIQMAHNLIDNWCKDKSKGKAKSNLDPIAYLAFDEAHTLTRPNTDMADMIVLSPFSHLWKILRSCRELPLFAVFLSTTGKINQFVLPKEDDDSAWLQHGALWLIPPFCALGWDHGAALFPVSPMRLSDVASLDFKAHLGHPLWVFPLRA